MGRQAEDEYHNVQGELLGSFSDRDVHHKRTKGIGTQKYLKENCYYRIECSAANFLTALMWRRPLKQCYLGYLNSQKA